MPELPEVQTIVNGLNQKIRGRKIVDLWTDWPKYFGSFAGSTLSSSKGKLLKGETNFRRHVIGKKILKVVRRGKNVLFHLSDDHLMLIHQKMSGHLMVGWWRPKSKFTTSQVVNLPEKWREQKWIPDPSRGPAMDPMNRFIRLIFFLDNRTMLALSDLRRFAEVMCGPTDLILNLPDLKELGPEPLGKKFTYKNFRELFRSKDGRIKQALMDQKFITGIGNIYADEILWVSKIHPLRKIGSLKEKDLRVLYRAIGFILKKALRLRGTSIDDYRDAEGRRGKYDLVRYAYQREDEPCSRCKTKIKRLKIGGRSAHFCPKCQQL